MEIVILIGALVSLSIFLYLKSIIWDKPQQEIYHLKAELERSDRNYQQEKIKAENNYKEEIERVTLEKNQIRLRYNKLQSCLDKFQSNLTAIPYMAGMIADIETYGLENLALGLSTSRSQKQFEKIKSIREIRKDALAMVEKNKAAQYQLDYLLNLLPNLTDIIESDYNDLPPIQINELSEYDHSRDYLSKEEYLALTPTERNQLALDRYLNSHNKTKWQIGRDYEQYIGYQYRKKGYDVDNYGAYMGLEDLGRDIIAKKDDITLIIQCKYWSSIKHIHEKHIAQLYGTTISYCIENHADPNKVQGILVTNIQLSETAKKMASYLGIKYTENYPMGKYPCIKCNIGHDTFGETKIYHLPFDQQYDITKIKKKGEFYAMTVSEAEAAGFRRTYKWFGGK